jgi:hypothetical protein
MRERLGSSRLTLTVTMLYTLVALAIGFLHVSSGPSPADSIAFRSALAFAKSVSTAGGGELVFCVQDDGTGQTALPRVCDACLLTAAPGLASGPDDGLALPDKAGAVLESAGSPANAPASRPRPTSRGPPAISHIV